MDTLYKYYFFRHGKFLTFFICPLLLITLNSCLYQNLENRLLIIYQSRDVTCNFAEMINFTGHSLRKNVSVKLILHVDIYAIVYTYPFRRDSAYR